MKETHQVLAAATLFLSALVTVAVDARAQEDEDALINYNLALAAKERGDEGSAATLFKAACMAAEGHAEACLEWGALASARGDEKSAKRAYGSAVMLAPDDVRARFELAMLLLGKEDWVWAIEHLEAALAVAEDPEDRALLLYYLGYAEHKNGDLEPAQRHFAQAAKGLPPDLAQKAVFYRGLCARRVEERQKAVALLRQAIDGPDAVVAEAARATIKSWTSFPRLEGWGGQVMAALGYNSHPLSGFLDDPGTETPPVLQAELRGDLMIGTRTGYAHGFLGGVTAYRQESLEELEDRGQGQMPADEMNFTMLLFQSGYVGRGWALGMEHEVRLGFDADLQFLDTKPAYDEVEGRYTATDVPLAVLARTVGGRAQWSMAPSPDSIWGLRLKVDVMDNVITPDMSALRVQLRAFNTSHFLSRKLQLRTAVGGRYDRTFRDPAVIKYDRLRPELQIDLEWASPWRRLSASLGGKLVYNWYMNSRGSRSNSFRPPWSDPVWPDGNDEDNLPDPMFTEEENARFEADYLELRRHDFEWELSLQVDLALWKMAALALRYMHHQRYSNMDGAPRPMVYNQESDTYAKSQGARFGYDQDVVMLQLTQAF